ncbi:hypothetical protein J5226_12920 [Lysobacter sp. K5869]|uniref:packaged DNA stabilization gp4 family protein n=1 Tax=Lysobacter sp. K5869 TaxID=2820808 RepID=UPI001C05F77E|nr:packaged DNA stabilization gp4 family protein [Lysobacter sp. K5869]QWP79227.1 hypothetical protein J5226_12920 [Lysobacter sp. K5869]
MSKVADIIRDALRHLRVQDPRQPVTAEAARDALRMLNLMMRAWEGEGLAVGWIDVTDITETLPLPPEAELGVGYNLAVVLRPGYGAELDPDVKEGAEHFLETLARDVLRFSPIRHGDDLPTAEGDGGAHYGVLGRWPRQ